MELTTTISCLGVLIFSKNTMYENFVLMVYNAETNPKILNVRYNYWSLINCFVVRSIRVF